MSRSDPLPAIGKGKCSRASQEPTAAQALPRTARAETPNKHEEPAAAQGFPKRACSCASAPLTEPAAPQAFPRTAVRAASKQTTETTAAQGFMRCRAPATCRAGLFAAGDIANAGSLFAAKLRQCAPQVRRNLRPGHDAGGERRSRAHRFAGTVEQAGRRRSMQRRRDRRRRTFLAEGKEAPIVLFVLERHCRLLCWRSDALWFRRRRMPAGERSLAQGRTRDQRQIDAASAPPKRALTARALAGDTSLSLAGAAP